MQTIEAIWSGPYSWPGFESENDWPALPKQPGLYLQTVEYNGGYLIYAAGLTRRPVAQRMREHTRKYKMGDYNVLSLAAMQRGQRHEIWHGWGWTPAKRAEFERRKAEIDEATRQQLAGFRLFVADIGTQPRLLERLEAALMNALYRQPPPLCEVPDQGMMLAPRKASEAIILVHNHCDRALHGLTGLPGNIASHLGEHIVCFLFLSCTFKRFPRVLFYRALLELSCTFRGISENW